MVVSLMQPYFFPYIGYFQLMAACDLFVVRDDVQYIERGWVNRNRILAGGAARWITMPVAKASHALPIAARSYVLDHPSARRIRRRIVAAYERAPYFPETMPAIDEALACQDSNVAAFNTRLLRLLAERLGIRTPVRMASEFQPTGSSGGERVIEICNQVGASVYVNPIGGAHLYDSKRFAAAGLGLKFLRPFVPLYPQLGLAPVPTLSIIDVLMSNDTERVGAMLGSYVLIPAPWGTPNSSAANEVIGT